MVLIALCLVAQSGLANLFKRNKDPESDFRWCSAAKHPTATQLFRGLMEHFRLHAGFFDDVNLEPDTLEEGGAIHYLGTSNCVQFI